MLTLDGWTTLSPVPRSHLMTDPKSRKVIVLENPLLPTRFKEMIARRLFEDFQVRCRLLEAGVLSSCKAESEALTRRVTLARDQVPSISFFPPQLLALLATGRTTGLVVDVGHLETVILPVGPSF